MPNTRMQHALALAAALTLVVGARSVTAQTPAPEGARGEEPARAQAERRRGREPMEGEAPPRAFLERRLEDLRTEAQRLEDAIRRMDAGGSPEEVRRALAPARPRTDAEAAPPDEGRAARRAERFRPRAPMPPEARERILAFLQEHAPEAAQRLQALAHERPMFADRVFAEIAGDLHELRALRERDPALFGVRLRAVRLDWELRRLAFDHALARRQAADGGPPPDEAALRRQAADLFGRRFDVGLEERTLQMREMTDRLERLKAEVQSGADRRAEVVNEQVERMLGHLRHAPKGPHGPDHAPDDHPPHGDGRGHGDDRPPPTGEPPPPQH